MINGFDLVAIAAAGAVAIILLHPAIKDSDTWRATVTPLASIVGSGFLIVAPLLAVTVGSGATLAITAIVLVSLWLGSAIRYTIGYDPTNNPTSTPQFDTNLLGKVSDLILAAAYVISIAFYIRLLAAFVLTSLNIDSEFAADLLSTGILLFIGVYGMCYGLHGLERLEEYSVTVKLSIIAALLLWLLHYDVLHLADIRNLHFPQVNADPFEQIRVLCGMLLVVQGFETSKYLGAEYAAPLRARTLLRAQLIAGAIYILFVALITPLMTQIEPTDVSETAIIEMSRIVTPLLPPLLVLAAVMSQFSASVADTLGAGGVVERQSNHRIPGRLAYLFFSISAAVLIWTTNIYEIVALASRAFALFYLLQAIQAAIIAAFHETGPRQHLLVMNYGVLSIAMLFIVIFAKAAEGG